MHALSCAHLYAHSHVYYINYIKISLETKEKLFARGWYQQELASQSCLNVRDTWNQYTQSVLDILYMLGWCTICSLTIQCQHLNIHRCWNRSIQPQINNSRRQKEYRRKLRLKKKRNQPNAWCLAWHPIRIFDKASATDLVITSIQ